MIKKYVNNEEEMRDNYLVTTKQKKIWNIELNLLIELLKVCKENDIKIFAFAGTLLGAIRHNGFIPWDDDLDMAMTRSDFNKFIKLADSFKKPYFLQYALNDREFFVDYARLRDSRTTGIISWNKSVNYNNGIYIDIFVLDGIPESNIKLKWQMLKLKLIRNIIFSYNKKHIERWPFLRRPIMFFLHILSKMKNYENWYELYNKIISESDASEKVGLLTHGERVLKSYWLNRKDFDNLIYIDFEGISLPCPSGYDHILKNSYDNYMDFPPLNQRGKWHEGKVTFDPDVSYVEYILNH